MNSTIWIIFGAGAQGKITLEVVNSAHPLVECLVADDNLERVGQSLLGRRIISREQILRRARERELRMMVAIGNNPQRLRIAHELAEAGLQFATAIHPSAVVSPSAEIAPGCFIGPLAMIGCGARIGQHAIVNSGAIVEHDCTVDDGASVSPGARLAGRVQIGRGAFVGTGAVVNPRLSIGSQAIVGGGAVVTRSVPPGMLAYGVPAKPVRPVDADCDWQKLL